MLRNGLVQVLEGARDGGEVCSRGVQVLVGARDGGDVCSRGVQVLVGGFALVVARGSELRIRIGTAHPDRNCASG